MWKHNGRQICHFVGWPVLLFIALLASFPIAQAQSEQYSNVYIDAPKAHFALTAQQSINHEFFLFRLVPRPEATLTEATVQVNAQFCSQCGEWQILYNVDGIPTHSNHTFACFSKLGGNGTGTILSPAKCLLPPIAWNTKSSHILALYVNELNCDVSITATAVNASRAHAPSTGSISARRGDDSSSIVVEFTHGNDLNTPIDKLEYRLFWIKYGSQ